LASYFEQKVAEGCDIKPSAQHLINIRAITEDEVANKVYSTLLARKVTLPFELTPKTCDDLRGTM
jgi:hypothetical protein